ncbi:MAG: tRNA lysidine(34) synthetase TilS [Halanaerobiales bacterium]
MGLYTDFCNYIREEKLIRTGEAIVLGVSGGPDSMVMLDLFSQIKDEFKLELLIFHLNHMFREEAKKEAIYVKNIADKYGFNSIIEEFDVPYYIKKMGFSPEEGARKARFNIIRDICQKLSIKKVALAHNKDDQVETVFLNLIRGTALKGLTGINARVDNGDYVLIHPLLFLSRREIEDYCQKHKLKPVRDPSNQETDYTRNKLRNHLLPYIEKEINPAVKDVVYRMSSNLKEEEEFLQNLAAKKFNEILLKNNKKELVLSLEQLQNENLVIRKRICKKALESLQGHVVDLYSTHYQIMEEFIANADTGKSIDLKDDIRLKTSYQDLIFENGKQISNKEFYIPLSIPGELKTDDFIVSTEIIDKSADWRKFARQDSLCLCDYQKIELPLAVRNRRDGDYFFPFNMNGSKKIKDFFIDEKVPLDKRDKIPLIVDAKDRIVWVASYRTDDRFRIDQNTAKILKIGIKFTGGD